MSDSVAPGGIILNTEATDGYSLITPSAIAADVRDMVRRVSSCEPSPQLAKEIETVAVAQLEAGAPIPIDETRLTDRLLIAKLVALGPWLVKLQVAAEAAFDAYAQAKRDKARCLKGLPWVWEAVIVAGGVAFGVCAARAATYVLSLPMESVVVRPQLDPGAFDSSPESWRMAIDMAQAFAILAVALPIGSVLTTRGRLHWTLKLLCVVVDLLFSGAFAGIRAERGFTQTAIAWTAFEFVTVFGASIYAFGLGKVLALNVDRKEQRLLAEAAEEVLKQEHEDRAEAERKGSEIYARQYDLIAVREQVAVRLPRMKELQAAAARREVIVTHAELASETFSTLVEELKDTSLRDHLAREFVNLRTKEAADAHA